MNVGPGVRIWLAFELVDMRLAFDGLAAKCKMTPTYPPRRSFVARDQRHRGQVYERLEHKNPDPPRMETRLRARLRLTQKWSRFHSAGKLPYYGIGRSGGDRSTVIRQASV